MQVPHPKQVFFPKTHLTASEACSPKLLTVPQRMRTTLNWVWVYHREWEHKTSRRCYPESVPDEASAPGCPDSWAASRLMPRMWALTSCTAQWLHEAAGQILVEQHALQSHLLKSNKNMDSWCAVVVKCICLVCLARQSTYQVTLGTMWRYYV
jgi:hypothetical protein